MLHFAARGFIIAYMKYFIDFEATQFSNEIISVGCIDETGREFYSLVKPHDLRRLTSFITDLTGIHVGELASAPSADKVFSDFYEWLDRGDTAEFFCYGNCDDRFVTQTMRHVNGFSAQCALSLIHGALNDFSLTLAKHFGITQPVSLAKATEYYSGEKIKNEHNSLYDAINLKLIYERSYCEELTECPFPEYGVAKPEKEEEQPQKRDSRSRIEATNGHITKSFYTYGRAANWVLRELMSCRGDVDEKTKSNVCNRIIRAVGSDKPYYGYDWYIVEPIELEHIEEDI